MKTKYNMFETRRKNGMFLCKYWFKKFHHPPFHYCMEILPDFFVTQETRRLAMIPTPFSLKRILDRAKHKSLLFLEVA